MPSATLALAFLVTGYFFIYRLVLTRSIISRATGHIQYFLAAAGGATTFVLSVLVAHLPHANVLDAVSYQSIIDVFLQYFSRSISEERRTFLQAQAALIAAGLCFIVPAILNAPLRRNARLTKYILSRFGAVGPLEMALDRCLRRQHPVLITQNSGKFYIGYVLEGATDVSEWLRIHPVFSGYRDSLQKICITTDYTWIDQLEPDAGRYESEDNIFREDFAVLIKLDTILTVHGYDLRTAVAGGFAYDPEPIQKKTEPNNDDQVKEEDSIIPPIYIPDWVHHPMSWKPPTTADYEKYTQQVKFDLLYPEGKPLGRFSLTIKFQRPIYFVYTGFIVITPLLAACGRQVDIVFCVTGALLSGLVAAWRTPHL